MPGIRPVIRDHRHGGGDQPVAVSRCLSAAGIRFSVIPGPPRNSALLTVSLPDNTFFRDLDGVTAFRAHELRPGWAPSIPRGPMVLIPAGRTPRPASAAFSAASPCTWLQHPSREALLDEASTRVQAIRPSGLPLARGRPDGTGRRLGFPPSFAPRRPGAGRRTSGWGQAIEHGPGTTSSTHIGSVLQSSSSLIACDLASHVRFQQRDVLASASRSLALRSESSSVAGGLPRRE
jgi:hypothetical protein